MELYIVYKTTHVPSGRYYIGRHVTSKLNDGYMGSGKLITRLLEAYPKTEFIKQILLQAASPIEMIEVENLLIGMSLDEPLCLNLIQGDPQTVGVIRHSAETKRRISEAGLGRKSWNKGVAPTLESREKNRQSNLGRPPTKGSTGYKQTEEALSKMRGKRGPRTPSKDTSKLSEATKLAWAPGGARRIAYDMKKGLSNG